MAFISRAGVQEAGRDCRDRPISIELNAFGMTIGRGESVELTTAGGDGSPEEIKRNAPTDEAT